MLEQQIQTKIVKKLEADGYYVIKLIKTSKNGIADLLALKDGKATFIEVKQPKGVVSELQKLRKKELEDKGFEYLIWCDYGLNYSKKH
jgi:Holliday junction resolvase